MSLSSSVLVVTIIAFSLKQQKMFCVEAQCCWQKFQIDIWNDSKAITSKNRKKNKTQHWTSTSRLQNNFGYMGVEVQCWASNNCQVSPFLNENEQWCRLAEYERIVVYWWLAVGGNYCLFTSRLQNSCVLCSCIAVFSKCVCKL